MPQVISQFCNIILKREQNLRHTDFTCPHLRAIMQLLKRRIELEYLYIQIPPMLRGDRLFQDSVTVHIKARTVYSTAQFEYNCF